MTDDIKGCPYTENVRRKIMITKIRIKQGFHLGNVKGIHLTSHHTVNNIWSILQLAYISVNINLILLIFNPIPYGDVKC